ncbi:MAG: hypothetical protein ISR99_00155 [Parcubacteria group bacterium]|nr:hypothetical protein [Parcubacteria group bacterium]
MKKEDKNITDTATKALAVLGFIAILGVGAFAGVKVVKLLPNALSSLAAVTTSITSIFIPSKEVKINTLDSDLSSDTLIEVSDTYTPTRAVTEGRREDRAFPLTGEVSNVPLVGEADLTARVLSTGIVDRSTNSYTATTTIKTSDRAAIRFEIENIGGKPTGAWTFNVVLPTYPSHIFHSTTQRELASGDKIEFTMGFDQIADNEEGEIIINVDPTQSVKEKTKENNIVKHTIKLAR